jgi:hypothetical protein
MKVNDATHGIAPITVSTFMLFCHDDCGEEQQVLVLQQRKNESITKYHGAVCPITSTLAISIAIGERKSK